MPLSLTTLQTEIAALLRRHPHLPDAARYIRLVRREGLHQPCRCSRSSSSNFMLLAAADQASIEALLRLFTIT